MKTNSIFKLSFAECQEKLNEADNNTTWILKPEQHKFQISEVMLHSKSIHEGMRCYKDQIVCSIIAKREVNDQIFGIRAQESGFIHYSKETYNKINDGDMIFEILPLESKFNNIPNYEEDLFNNCTNIKWKQIGFGSRYREHRLDGFITLPPQNDCVLFMSLMNLNSSDFIVLNYPSRFIKIKKGDTFHLLLEDGKCLIFNFDKNANIVYESYDSNLKKIAEAKTKISYPDLLILKDSKVINWKLNLQERGEIIGRKPLENCHPLDIYSNVINHLAKDYLSEVQKLKDYSPIYEYNKKGINQSEQCYVYLMIDTTNHLHKIGISNNPEYRERTLQSEKPTIELIVCKKYPTRLIAESIEKALHSSFKNKNIRGEWFKLTQEDINSIINTFQ